MEISIISVDPQRTYESADKSKNIRLPYKCQLHCIYRQLRNKGEYHTDF